MRKKLTNNLGLKILAVLFSACLWIIAININDPVTQDSYNVSVKMLNMATLTSAGKYVEVLDNTDSIRVTVRGSRNVLTNFSGENIVATADLTKMEEDGMVPIELSTTKISDKIESIRSDKQYVYVNVENISKQQLPITVNVQNEPQEGYILGNTYAAQNVVIVSGPESVVSKIDKAAVEINVDDAISDVNISLPILLYDDEGNVVDMSKITMSKNEVSTTASILETKEIPINCTYAGSLLDGYIVTGKVQCEPQTVTVAAKSNVIRKLNAVEATDAIDISGCDSDAKAQIDVNEYLPDGVSVVNGTGKVNVTVHIVKEAEEEMNLSASKVHITNVPDGYSASLDEDDAKIAILVAGLKSEIDTINEEELVGVVDIAKYMEEEGKQTITSGTYSIPVDITFGENTRLARECKVRVKVKGE